MQAENDTLGPYFREVRRYPPLRPDQERLLGRRFKSGDVAAGQALVTANLRFVVKVAGEFRWSGLPLADLVQEGNLGLMKAVSKFDPERGLRLISYAVWWIRAYVQAYVLRSWSLVKMGTTQAQRRLFQTLSQERRHLQQRSSAEPDDEELARRLSVKACEVTEMRTRMSCRDVSLDAPIRGHADFSLINLLPGEEAASPEEQFSESEDERLHVRHLNIALSRLDQRDRLILKRRALTEQPVSLQVVADELGVSSERIRQLEIRARLKIRATLDSFEEQRQVA